MSNPNVVKKTTPTPTVEDIIGEATARQNKAAHPATSVWVSANAGTGKTHVLINRILRLLLENEECTPQNILALTYTNAAAAEMRERLHQKLESLATSTAEEQREALTKLLGYPSTTAHSDRLNTLVHSHRDTPLQAQTLHAFCQKFLHLFPLEAAIPPNFELLIDPEQKQHITQIMDTTLQACMAEDNALHPWYIWLAQNMAPTTLREELLSLIYAMPKLISVLEGHGGIEKYGEFLAGSLGLNKQALPTPQDVPTAFTYTLSAKDYDNLHTIKQALIDAGKKVKFADKVNDMLVQWPPLSADAYVNLFITKKNKASGVLPKLPEIQAVAHALEEEITTYNAKRAYVHTMALIKVSMVIHHAFTQFKQQHGYVDYTDLIHHALHVLTNTAQRAWVHFRLDSRIQHVLLDEGQDIDTEQWQLLQAIIQDFYTGEGGHDAPRTLFAVGDIKQAIFRFRGSVPAIFKAIWEEKLNTLPPHFPTAAVDMQTSFRCAPAVLDVVDQVMHTANVSTQHQSSRVGSLGRVELWPLIKKEATRPPPQTEFNWHIPTESQQKETTPRVQLMQQVAAKMKELLNSNTVLPSTGKPISASDMYVLVRTRTALPELITCLSQAGIPYTGLDQEDGMDHPMVQDIVALLQWLMRPDNNMLMVHVLRSPLIGITEKQWLALHALSQEKNITYYAALETCMPAVFTKLKHLRHTTQAALPYATLITIMQQFNLRQRYWRHYFAEGGASGARYIYQLCAILLEHAAEKGGNIQSYINLLKENGLKLPQGLVQANAVRLLTAHKAKGLEAPIVFLPDTTQAADMQIKKDTLLWLYTNDITPALVVDNPSENRRTLLHDKLREEEVKRLEEDNRNLLYVAMTRAKDMLFIGGAVTSKKEEKDNSTKAPENSWYAMVHKACKANADSWQSPAEGLYIYTTGTASAAKATPVEPTAEASSTMADASHTWLHTLLTHDNAPATDEKATLPAQTGYGEAVHWVLEHFITYKNYPPVAAIALKFPLCDAPRALGEAKLCVEKCAVLRRDNAKAEVTIGKAHSIWRLDYVHISADTVTIIDFKTHAPVPENVPHEFVQQLARYKAHMQKIYPQHTVRTGVLWTHTSYMQWLTDDDFSALDI